MATISNHFGTRPITVLFRSVVTNNRLLPVEPAWFKRPNELKHYGLLILRSGFWLPIKDFRLVHRDVMPRVIAATRKAKAFYSVAIFLGSIAAANSFLESFRIYSRAGEHLMLNVFIIGMTLFLFPGILLLWRGRIRVKDLPVAEVNESVLAAKKKINIAYWIINIITILLTAVLSAIKESAQGSAKNEAAVEVTIQTHETAVEQAPQIAAEAIVASTQGSTTIAASLGLCIFRILLGSGIALGSTVLLLGVLSPAVHSAFVFFMIFGIAATALVVWEIYIYRKYRLP